ncbi:MAG: MmcQ/YjbR family DNA-binding protein [Saprospiraceae bacterium]
MDVQYLREYCLKKKGVEECFPFDQVTLVFKVMGKMFALVGLDKHPASVNLKCNPQKAEELRMNYPDTVLPGYHMSKIHWNTVLLESELDVPFIKYLIDHSYELIVNSLPKKVKLEWDNLPNL